MEGAVIRGVIGHVKWGYANAAIIHGYVVTRSGPKAQPVWSLHAKALWLDPFKVRQRPLDFVAPFGVEGGKVRGEWRWPVIAVEVGSGGTELRARLGPPEEKR